MVLRSPGMMEIKEITQNTRPAAQQRAVNDPPVLGKARERAWGGGDGLASPAGFSRLAHQTGRSFTAGRAGDGP